MIPHAEDERFHENNPRDGIKSYPLFQNAASLDDDLSRAIQAKDLTAVKSLISQGAMANSVFETAAADGLHDIVKYLINKGADTNFSQQGVPPLHHAILKSDLQMIKILFSSSKTETNPFSTKYSQTAIEVARNFQGTKADEVLKYLLEINHKD